MTSPGSDGTATLEPAEVSAFAGRIVAEVESVMVGRSEAIVLVLAALFSRRHILVEDRPGVGKTVLAKAVAAALGLPTSRIQGTADLLPTDITGTHIFSQSDGTWPFRAGPIFSSVVLIDEVNRATPKAQSALLEAMAENQVTVDGETKALPNPFFVIATQNPRSDTGTYPLLAGQMDRFAMMIRMGLPGRTEERSLLTRDSGHRNLDAITPAVSQENVTQILAVVDSVTVDPMVVEYVLDLIEAVRNFDPRIWLSPRATQDLADLARAVAAMYARSYVIPEDIQRVVPVALAHRLPAEFDGSLISGILQSVPVPVPQR